MKLGIDLDNTVIDYSNSYKILSRQFNYPRQINSRNKIRETFRRNDGKDDEWQKFQAELYTRGLTYARPGYFVLEFIEKLKIRGIELFIVSHKTKNKKINGEEFEFRITAKEWLISNKIVPNLINDSNVIFCETRDLKVKVIENLNLNYFIDDLVEVLEHEYFPSKTVGIYYDPENGINFRTIYLRYFDDKLA